MRDRDGSLHLSALVLDADDFALVVLQRPSLLRSDDVFQKNWAHLERALAEPRCLLGDIHTSPEAVINETAYFIRADDGSGFSRSIAAGSRGFLGLLHLLWCPDYLRFFRHDCFVQEAFLRTVEQSDSSSVI